MNITRTTIICVASGIIISLLFVIYTLLMAASRCME